MARFYGEVGYSISTDMGNGVFKPVITKRMYRGDVLKNTRQLGNGEKVNDDLSVSNSISVVADEYAYDHFHAIRFVKWAGAYWKVDDVQVQRPRLLLRLGGIHNGPTG